MDVRCQCGTATFKTPALKPMAVYHCHCTECQKQSSSAFGTSAVFAAQGLFPIPADLMAKLRRWTRPTKHGRTMDCYFCKACGVRLMHRIREADGKEWDTAVIKGGVIQGLCFDGAKHIYVRSAVVEIPEGVEKWDAEPEVMEGRPQPGYQKSD